MAFAISWSLYYVGNEMECAHAHGENDPDLDCPGSRWVLRVFETESEAINTLRPLAKEIMRKDDAVLEDDGDPTFVMLNDDPPYPSNLKIEEGTREELLKRMELAKMWHKEYHDSGSDPDSSWRMFG